MATLKIDVASFKTMSDEALALVARSQAMRAEALRAAEAIREASAQLESLDLRRIVNNVHYMSKIARNPRAAEKAEAA